MTRRHRPTGGTRGRRRAGARGQAETAIGDNPARLYSRSLGDGLALEGRISPCVFMYPGYPLQIHVTLRGDDGKSLGDAYAVDRTRSAATTSVADVRRLLATVRITPCRRCANPAFDPASVETNRAGLCESCFMADLKAEFIRSEEAEHLATLARDRRMKGRGMAVRVSAWVHPERGGEDYQVDWYLKHHPTPEQVRMVLLRLGSSVCDDYQIVVL